ncbi:hypothetical protein FOA52_011474 [Chlamydomonas sp. UWO 241]|nr:hypothetical protein FOA52_011474 [Chlamydomonas sp. UWO 241]
MQSITARMGSAVRPSVSVGRVTCVKPIAATKLYIGNISWSTQREDLAELFGKYGTVEDAFIPMDRETGRSRGFAFVTLEQDDGAKAAIDEINETEFMGRTIRVNEAAPREEGAMGGRGGGRGGGGRGYAGRGGGGGGGRGYGQRRENDE